MMPAVTQQLLSNVDLLLPTKYKASKFAHKKKKIF
jgi:hypothetical protein